MAFQADITITAPTSFSTVVHALNEARPIITDVPILGPIITGYRTYYEWIGRLGDFFPSVGIYEYTFLSGTVHFLKNNRRKKVFKLDGFEENFFLHPIPIWFPFKEGQTGGGWSYLHGGRCPHGDIAYEITSVIYA